VVKKLSLESSDKLTKLVFFCRQHMVPNSSLENAFRTHLTSALGYYHHLLCRLQSEFDLSLAMCVDFYYIPESKTRKFGCTFIQTG